MMDPLFDLDVWDTLSSERRAARAQRIAAELPKRFRYAGLHRPELGGVSHEIARFFYIDGGEFALIPGGRVSLGYDPERPFPPSAHQQEEWKETYEHWGNISLEEELEMTLTPAREAVLAPFLIETRCVLQDDLFDDLTEEEMADKDLLIRRVCGEEFRLPTTDEWEYVCGGGAKTLFRWGNETPPVECWEVKGWDLHRRPNAFGLILPEDTYQLEVCEGGVLRGGDGGGAVHGGRGVFATWIPLASAFACHDQESEWYDAPLPEQHWRRVYPLGVIA